MPSVSKAEHNYMEMIAHSPDAAPKGGPSKAVAKDFVLADIGRKLGGLPEHKKPKKGGRK